MPRSFYFLETTSQVKIWFIRIKHSLGEFRLKEVVLQIVSMNWHTHTSRSPTTS